MDLHRLLALGRHASAGGNALRFPDGENVAEISHDELARQVDHLAGCLFAGGLRAGDRVVLFLGNRPELALTFLAVTRLGAIVIPLNLAYRHREIAHTLADAEPRLLVTEEAQAETLRSIEFEKLPAAPEWIVRVEDFSRMEPAPPADRPYPRAHDLAAILYTSGTTGQSKGAMISHGNLVATICALRTAWAWTPADRLLLTLPLFHTHGLVVGLLTALAAGACVELRRRFDAEAVVDELSQGQATLFFGVPTLYLRLLRQIQAQPGADFSNVRLFCSGSAPLDPSTFTAFRERTGHEILERYGMTETGMNLSNPFVGDRVPGTVGLPLPGVSIRIVDERDRPVPDGEAGELLLRGPNVFDGYWRRPDATRESFLVDEAGRRWFRSGDLARVDPESAYVTLLGRSRELILSGGFNVYPREIEEALLTHPSISEAAVVGRPHPEWGETPVAFVVSEEELDPEEIRSGLRGQLAAFKIPREFHRIDRLPRNALGKVQKHRLPE